MNVKERDALRQAILCRLSEGIDPETGGDVVRMRLIEDLTIEDQGTVRYTFRPSSPLCPLALPSALSIRKAVAEVDGVTGQAMEAVGYVKADELNAILAQAGVTKRG